MHKNPMRPFEYSKKEVYTQEDLDGILQGQSTYFEQMYKDYSELKSKDRESKFAKLVGDKIDADKITAFKKLAEFADEDYDNAESFNSKLAETIKANPWLKTVKEEQKAAYKPVTVTPADAGEPKTEYKFMKS